MSLVGSAFLLHSVLGKSEVKGKRIKTSAVWNYIEDKGQEAFDFTGLQVLSHNLNYTPMKWTGEHRLLEKKTPMCLSFQGGLCYILPPLSCSLVQPIFESRGMKKVWWLVWSSYCRIWSSPHKEVLSNKTSHSILQNKKGWKPWINREVVETNVPMVLSSTYESLSGHSLSLSAHLGE